MKKLILLTKYAYKMMTKPAGIRYEWYGKKVSRLRYTLITLKMLCTNKPV